jgi:hypothetical protein
LIRDACVLLAPAIAAALALAFAPGPDPWPDPDPCGASDGAAQSAPLAPGDNLCGECKTSGRVAFELPKPVVELEKGCLYCSEVADSKPLNYGLDFLPCPKCKCPSLRDKVKADYDAKVAKGKAWLKKQREIDDYLNDPKDLLLMHVKTEHFDLAWSVPKLKVGTVVIDQHHAMHLYAERLEEAYKTYLDQFAFKHQTDQNGIRHQIMIFEQLRHANKAQPQYVGLGGQGATQGAKKVGPVSVFVTHWDKKTNPDDEALHEYVVHNACHLFLASNYNQLWLARKHGWIDEGLSHYFTEKKFGKCRTHCFQEQDEAKQWVLGPWRPEIRKRVAAGRLPVFSEVVVKAAESLTAEEALFVFSWVQYLNDAFDHKLFVQLIHGLKDEKLPLRDLLQSIYGVSPFQFIENWKKYVVETYPPR